MICFICLIVAAARAVLVCCDIFPFLLGSVCVCVLRGHAEAGRMMESSLHQSCVFAVEMLMRCALRVGSADLLVTVVLCSHGPFLADKARSGCACRAYKDSEICACPVQNNWRRGPIIATFRAMLSWSPLRPFLRQSFRLSRTEGSHACSWSLT